jgi:hypothetical protein
LEYGFFGDFPDVNLRLTNNNGWALIWEAYSGYSFWVEESTDLIAWETISNEIVGNNDEITFPVTQDVVTFWRLRVVEQTTQQSTVVSAKYVPPPPENSLPVITVYSNSITMEKNKSFSATLVAVGGDGVLTWNLENAPKWLDLNEGVLSYTASKKNRNRAGTYNVRVRVTDEDGDTDSVVITITIFQVKGKK